MSEFTNNAEKRIHRLTSYLNGVIKGKSGADLVKEYDLVKRDFTPSDVLAAFDIILADNNDMEEIKKASNKLFNLLYKTLENYPSGQIEQNSFLFYLKEDNIQIARILNEIRPLIKSLNIRNDSEIQEQLKTKLTELSNINKHYIIKENILFPVLEKEWEYHQCLKLMWSFHDDIRHNIRHLQEMINNNIPELERFNKISARLFFDIYTIIFREEKLLFPVIIQTIDQVTLYQMLAESTSMGFSFVRPEGIMKKHERSEIKENGIIKFATGNLSAKQLELILNHLPVDITFVDKNDIVQYFSSPENRIFPRTKAIIGRKVQNCHPPESIDVVNRIIDSFKNGEKDEASFWLHMGDKYVLIRYFAVRDNNNNYSGTLEVSQEISEIQKIKGNKRLLDWDKGE